MHKQDLQEQSCHQEIKIKELTLDLKQLEGLEIKLDAKILEIKVFS